MLWLCKFKARCLQASRYVPILPRALAVQVGGLLLVSPEHRLSLQLKRNELCDIDRAACEELDKLAALPYIDLMDEVDMLLHHKCVSCARRGGYGAVLQIF